MGERFSASHTVPMRVLKHKIDVSLFIDFIALYMNPFGHPCTKTLASEERKKYRRAGL